MFASDFSYFKGYSIKLMAKDLLAISSAFIVAALEMAVNTVSGT